VVKAKFYYGAQGRACPYFSAKTVTSRTRTHTVKVRNIKTSLVLAGKTRMRSNLPIDRSEVSNDFRNLVQHLRRCGFSFDPSRDQHGERIEYTSATFRVKGVAILALRPLAQPFGRPILSIRVLVVFLPSAGRPGIPRNSRTWSST